MIVYTKVNKGIVGDFKPKLNSDLIAYAVNSGMRIPKGYHPSIFSKEMLRNDYKKYTIAKNWSPKLEQLDWAKRALCHVFSPYLFAHTIPFKDAVQRMEKNTSPGFPWNQQIPGYPVYRTKKEVLENEYDLLEDIVNQLLEKGHFRYTWRGMTLEILIWMVSPKGEIRVMAKLINPEKDKRKTRTFMCADIIITIIMIMLYANQNDQMLNAHHFTWSKVGFSPFYGGFHSLAMDLLANEGELFDCYDVEHMEASLKEHIQFILYDIRHKYLLLDENYGRLAEFVKNQVIYSWLLDPDGWLGLMIGGNPSGSFNTLMDNTLALVFVTFYHLACKSSSYDDLLVKIQKHRCACIGDDSVIPHHPDFDGYVANCASLGFSVKPEKLCVPLSECVFTNCEFVRFNNSYYPRGNFDKIKANIYYHFKASSWRLCYVKCCALRILAWNFIQEREEAERLIHWIVKNHDRDMRAETMIDDKVSYQSALASYLEPRQIQFMWDGLESASPELISYERLEDLLFNL